MYKEIKLETIPDDAGGLAQHNEGGLTSPHTTTRGKHHLKFKGFIYLQVDGRKELY